MATNYWQTFEERSYYHIYNRCISNELIFRHDIDYESFLRSYTRYFNAYFKTLAYCLIPNHFHFCVYVREVGEEMLERIKRENTKASRAYLSGSVCLNTLLSDQFRRFFSSVSLKTNKKYNRRGPLFSGRVKRINLESDSKVIHNICYIHHNPIHHNFTNNYSEWKFSSYQSYQNNLNNIIDIEYLLKILGGNRKEGINIFESHHHEFLKNGKWK